MLLSPRMELLFQPLAELLQSAKRERHLYVVPQSWDVVTGLGPLSKVEFHETFRDSERWTFLELDALLRSRRGDLHSGDDLLPLKFNAAASSDGHSWLTNSVPVTYDEAKSEVDMCNNFVLRLLRSLTTTELCSFTTTRYRVGGFDSFHIDVIRIRELGQEFHYPLLTVSNVDKLPSQFHDCNWARTLSKAVTAVLMYNESAASVLIPKLLPLNCSGVIHLHPDDPFQCASELARYDPSGSYDIQVI